LSPPNVAAYWSCANHDPELRALERVGQLVVRQRQVAVLLEQPDERDHRRRGGDEPDLGGALECSITLNARVSRPAKRRMAALARSRRPSNTSGWWASKTGDMP
jgi:hypothetical protein